MYLVRKEDMVIKMEAGRGQVKLARLVIENCGVAIRFSVNCQDVAEAVIATDRRLEFITISEDTLSILRIETILINLNKL